MIMNLLHNNNNPYSYKWRKMVTFSGLKKKDLNADFQGYNYLFVSYRNFNVTWIHQIRQIQQTIVQ